MEHWTSYPPPTLNISSFTQTNNIAKLLAFVRALEIVSVAKCSFVLILSLYIEVHKGRPWKWHPQGQGYPNRKQAPILGSMISWAASGGDQREGAMHTSCTQGSCTKDAM